MHRYSYSKSMLSTHCDDVYVVDISSHGEATLETTNIKQIDIANGFSSDHNMRIATPSSCLDCTHPNFIKNYFLTSRLHHISTWKMDLTDYLLNAMKEASLSSFTSLSSNFFSQKDNHHKTTVKPKYHPSKADDLYRTIMHIDMDCFFASVGIRDRPHLTDAPIAVAHSINGVNMNYSTSEIASCNYIARSKGVKNGMFIGRAKQLEPNLHIIPYEFDKYDQVSKCLYKILLRHSNYVQAVSCDEAFIDVTYIVQARLKSGDSSENTSGPLYDKKNHANKYGDDDEGDDADDRFDCSNQREISRTRTNHCNGITNYQLQELYEKVIHSIAKDIKDDVYRSTGCNVSIGIAHNILLARLATHKAKPNGIFSLVSSYDIMSHLHSLPISKLPGIGSSISDKCSSLHIEVCSDLLKVEKKVLQHAIGSKTVDMLLSYAQGIDQRVLENRPRQSIGSEINWGIRFTKQSQIIEFLKYFCIEVFTRLNQSNFISRHVTLTVKKRLYEGEPGKYLGCGHCDDISRSMTCSGGRGIDSMEVLYGLVKGLYGDISKGSTIIQPDEVRGLGIHLKQLTSSVAAINHPPFLPPATSSTTTTTTMTTTMTTSIPSTTCLKHDDTTSSIEMNKRYNTKSPSKHIQCTLSFPTNGTLLSSATISPCRIERHHQNLTFPNEDSVPVTNDDEKEVAGDFNPHNGITETQLIVKLDTMESTHNMVDTINLEMPNPHHHTSPTLPCFDHQPTSYPLPTGIDPSVFYCLPVDIQNEILHMHNIRNNNSNMSPSVKAASTIALPPSITDKSKRKIISPTPPPKKQKIINKTNNNNNSINNSNNSRRRIDNKASGMSHVIKIGRRDDNQSKVSSWLLKDYNCSNSYNSSSDRISAHDNQLKDVLSNVPD